MATWKPIATAPRDISRPLLLYPRPHPVAVQPSEEPLLDLADPAVRRMIRLVKERGYITCQDLYEVLPPEEFTPEQIEDVLSNFSEMGVTVIRMEGEEKRGEYSQPAPLTVQISVFEGCWDGGGWRTSTGRPCEPTHWMPMPSPPPTLVRR